MKKVSLILLAVLAISLLLMAVAPLRLVRLNVINKSGHVVYMKLVGSSVGDQFYYLTIDKGSKELPSASTFTLVQDIYDRTTWYGPGEGFCEGWESSGELIATKNLKLTFTPCGEVPKTYGEPSWGEKVTFLKWVEGHGNGCGWVIWNASYKSPRGCFFHYQY